MYIILVYIYENEESLKKFEPKNKKGQEEQSEKKEEPKKGE